MMICLFSGAESIASRARDLSDFGTTKVELLSDYEQQGIFNSKYMKADTFIFKISLNLYL